MKRFKFSGTNGIDEATISSFYVDETNKNIVKQGDVLFDIEADKASESITSPFEGKILKINFKSGDNIKVGDVVIEFEGEDDEQIIAPNAKISPTKADVQTLDLSKKASEKIDCLVTNNQEVSNYPIKATRLARKAAIDLGIDLKTIKGSGSFGTILLADVNANKISLDSSNQELSLVPKTTLDASRIESLGEIEHLPLTGIRKAIANAMVVSKFSAPHVSLMIDVDATELFNLRKKLKIEGAKPEYGSVNVTFMPFFIKAVTKALSKEQFKLLNSTFNLAQNEILVKKYYNIGVAVDTERGLVVPVIRNANKLNIFELANEVNQLALKSKETKLVTSEMQGGTFTITNFGSAGIKFGTPIINFPEVAILGVGKLETKLELVDGNIISNKILPLSLSIDHRVVDGAPAGYFLQEIKRLLEDPTLLLI